MPDAPNTAAPLSVRDAVKLDKSFVHFDMNLSANEAAALQGLTVAKQDTYDNFAAVDQLKGEAGRFFESIGNTKDAAAQSAEIVDKLVREALSAFGAEAAWVTIRAFTPGDQYDMPRWHRDGYFYDPFSGDQRKVAMALKGAATLFNDLPEKLREEFNTRAHASKGDSPEARQKMAELIDARLTETAGPGQGSVFVVGSDNAAVHSEPPIHTERIFVSVMPGTKAQIEELRDRWKRQATTYTQNPAPPAVK